MHPQKTVHTVDEYARLLDEFNWLYNTEDLRDWYSTLEQEKYLRSLWYEHPDFEVMFKAKEGFHTHPRTSQRQRNT